MTGMDEEDPIKFARMVHPLAKVLYIDILNEASMVYKLVNHPLRYPNISPHIVETKKRV